MQWFKLSRCRRQGLFFTSWGQGLAFTIMESYYDISYLSIPLPFLIFYLLKAIPQKHE